MRDLILRNNVKLDEKKAINPRNIEFKPMLDCSLSSYKDIKERDRFEGIRNDDEPTSNEDNNVSDFPNKPRNIQFFSSIQASCELQSKRNSHQSKDLSSERTERLSFTKEEEMEDYIPSPHKRVSIKEASLSPPWQEGFETSPQLGHQ